MPGPNEVTRSVDDLSEAEVNALKADGVAYEQSLNTEDERIRAKSVVTEDDEEPENYATAGQVANLLGRIRRLEGKDQGTGEDGAEPDNSRPETAAQVTTGSGGSGGAETSAASGGNS